MTQCSEIVGGFVEDFIFMMKMRSFDDVDGAVELNGTGAGDTFSEKISSRESLLSVRCRANCNRAQFEFFSSEKCLCEIFSQFSLIKFGNF